MARKAEPAPPKRFKQFRPDEIPAALSALKARQQEIADATPPASPEHDALMQITYRLTAKALATFREVFGEDSREFSEASFDYIFPIPSEPRPYERLNWNACLAAFDKGKKAFASNFQTQIELLEEKASAVPESVG